MSRFLHNMVKTPRRTWESLQRRRDPVYRTRRLAEAYAQRELPASRYAELCGVPGNSSDWQCAVLFYLAELSPHPVEGSVMLEIGAFKGKSTAWLAEVARRQSRHLVSIDPLVEDSAEVFRETVQRFAIEEVATLHQAFSHDVGKGWDTPIDFLWIDGAHDYESVKQDVLDFTPHVRPGGYVVFDDINDGSFPGLVRAVDETIKRDARFEHLGEIKNTGLYRRRPA